MYKGYKLKVEDMASDFLWEWRGNVIIGLESGLYLRVQITEVKGWVKGRTAMMNVQNFRLTSIKSLHFFLFR